MWREYCDVGIVFGPIVIVWSSGQWVSFVGASRYMFEGEVVVCQVGEVACNATVDVVWVAVVFEVFVISAAVRSNTDRCGVGLCRNHLVMAWKSFRIIIAERANTNTVSTCKFTVLTADYPDH